MNIKPVEQCSDLEDIRSQVNALDREIIRLLGVRLTYVRGAVRYKPDGESISRPDHWERFFSERKAWGKAEGYPAAVVEDMYRRLYAHTVELQLALHREHKG